MTWIPPRMEDIASPLNPFFNLADSEVKQINPEFAKKLKESKMLRKEQLDLSEAIANVWTQQEESKQEEELTEEMLVEQLTEDLTSVVEAIQEDVGFELNEDEINYIVNNSSRSRRRRRRRDDEDEEKAKSLHEEKEEVMFSDKITSRLIEDVKKVLEEEEVPPRCSRDKLPDSAKRKRVLRVSTMLNQTPLSNERKNPLRRPTMGQGKATR